MNDNQDTINKKKESYECVIENTTKCCTSLITADGRERTRTTK